MKNLKKIIALSFIFAALSSSQALACACGCGVMNVATSSIIPNCEGGTAFLQYDHMSQSRNWSKHKKSNGHNHDHEIETQTTTAGAQYMFNRDFGAAIRVPYITRYVATQPHHSPMNHTRHSALGDIRVNGIYAGFFDDMSTGLTFGLKLPTGSTNDKGFERNTQIGTGSTDSILGAYHIGKFGRSNFGYFTQISWERPFITHQHYTPGYEVSYAVGTYYNAGQFGAVKKLSPMLQITGAKKGQDSGSAALDHNPNSGYHHIFFAPGIEIALESFKLYADVQFPIYRSVNGTQLAPQNIYKVILSRGF